MEEVREISIDLIDEPPVPIRSFFSQEELEDLSRSIRDVSLIEPVVVRSKNFRYEIIAGHRRYLAAKMAQLPSLLCRVVECNDHTADILRVQENLQRENVNPIDEGRYFQYLIEKYSFSVSDIAKMISKSESYVYSRLATCGFDDDFKNAVLKNEVPFSVAYELSKIEDPEQRKMLLRYAIDSGCSIQMARVWRSQFQTRGYVVPTEITIPDNPSDPPKPPTVTCDCCSEKLLSTDAKLAVLCRKCFHIIVEKIDPEEVLKSETPPSTPENPSSL
jgi:ParB/RepB/Spo0J family partition protein